MTFRQQPAERECLTAVWSQGRACKTCRVDCYRRGWAKAHVDRDNAALVKTKLARRDSG